MPLERIAISCMRRIDVKQITEIVKTLCIEANYVLPQSLRSRISEAEQTERNELGRQILGDLTENLVAAKELNVPICQDTGMAVIFMKLGQQVELIGGGLNQAVNEGVRQGYLEGNLRCSIVRDPLRRVNTDDNTPAILHLELVEGDKIEITVAPKGFGSENMSAIKMFNPSANETKIIHFVQDVVKQAGSNPCPPIVVGVGIGGDFELCALLAKKALCRDVGLRNPDPFYADLEERMLTQLNLLNIGPQGFGGDTTALAVNIEPYATHIAGLPVAVNIGCHVTRHKTALI